MVADAGTSRRFTCTHGPRTLVPTARVTFDKRNVANESESGRDPAEFASLRGACLGGAGRENADSFFPAPKEIKTNAGERPRAATVQTITKPVSF